MLPTCQEFKAPCGYFVHSTQHFFALPGTVPEILPGRKRNSLLGYQLYNQDFRKNSQSDQNSGSQALLVQKNHLNLRSDLSYGLKLGNSLLAFRI